MLGKRITNKSETTTEKFIWLKATYHFHVFHYRMPETVAIAAVTPFVPSPLTVKMAMIASLFQLGDINGVEIVAKNMHKIEVKIVPPKAALSFKAFLRYRSPPAVESQEKGLDETGSYYPSRPHMREYVIFQDNLEIYVRSPINLKKSIEKALKNVRYLGSKDSIVTCVEFSQVDGSPPENYCVNKLESQQGIVVLLADFKPDIQIDNVKQLIPGKRKEKMYEKVFYILPGSIKTKGKTKIFKCFKNIKNSPHAT